MKMPFEKRPTCSCGVKMKLVEFVGYYEDVRYWDCENCNINDVIDNYEPDKVWKGSYA